LLPRGTALPGGEPHRAEARCHEKSPTINDAAKAKSARRQAAPASAAAAPTGFAGGEERFVVKAGVDEVAEFVVEQRWEAAVAGEGGGVVGHVAGAVGEDGGANVGTFGAGVPCAAAFVAHEGEVPDVAFDVGDEGRFDLHDGAVFEADLADGEVFDGVGFMIPVGPVGNNFARLVAHVGPDVA